MVIEEAIKKAKMPVQPKERGMAGDDPYAIPFENAESARSLIGKTLRSRDPKNINALEIVKWIGQNYVLRVNGVDDYKVTPVMWVLQNLNKFQIN